MPGPHSANKRHTRRQAKPKQARETATKAPDMKAFSDARVLAALVIYQVSIEQKSLNTLLPEAMGCVKPQDKALLQELCFGTSRWYFWLKSLYQPLLSKALHRNDALVECLLCVGIYQLIFTRIPGHACLHETVEATEKLGLSRFKGLVNALLRQISQQEYVLEDPDLQQTMHRLSHPQWLQDKLSHNWPTDWLSILTENNLHPPMSLRINRAFEAYRDMSDAAEIQHSYLAKLRAQGLAAQASRISPLGIVLEQACAVDALPDFQQGGVSIQDEAAQLSCGLLDLQAGLRVLDACAAPGGKTCAMLEHQSDLTMLALDADAKRASRIQENLNRLHLSAEIKVAQAEKLDDWWDGQYFDRILLDAPCSATGVIRRHPDIKLLRQETDILALAQTQLTLLSTLWQSLKPGGLLLYATCSVFAQENSRIIERFLKQQQDAQLSVIDADWGLDTGFGRQLLPKANSHDGFFYARLIKTSQVNQHETADTEKV